MSYNTAVSDSKYWKITFDANSINIGDNIEVYWACPMIEQKDIDKPSFYITNSRGTTLETGGGWKDLSNINDGSLSSNTMSFDRDSNGSLIFNGTSDLVGGLNQGLHVCFSQGNNSLLYLNGIPNDYYTYGGDLGNIGWVLSTFRFKNSNGSRTIYKNTTNISTFGPNQTSTPFGQSSTFTIGTVGINWMQGSLSNIMFYNRYITNNELTQNYNALKSRFTN